MENKNKAKPAVNAETAKKQAVTPPKDVDQIFKPPQITRQPSNRSCSIGSKAIFQIMAAAVPAPKYQWFHNGSIIAGATGRRLILPKVRQSDVGVYTCEARNFAGSVSSRRVTLMIVQEDIPKFTITPAKLTLRAGEPALLKIQFDNPQTVNLRLYKIQWFFDGRRIRGANKPDLSIKRVDSSLNGAFTVKLTLKTNANAYRNSGSAKLIVQPRSKHTVTFPLLPPNTKTIFFAAEAKTAEQQFFTFGQTKTNIKIVAPPPIEEAIPEEEFLNFLPEDKSSLSLDAHEDAAQQKPAREKNTRLEKKKIFLEQALKNAKRVFCRTSKQSAKAKALEKLLTKVQAWRHRDKACA